MDSLHGSANCIQSVPQSVILILINTIMTILIT